MSAENVLRFSKELLEKQRKALFEKKTKADFAPWTDALLPKEKEAGLALLKQAKAACVILCGGQGTRLKWEGPKGLYPIVPEKNLTLLQILLNKTLARSLEFALPLEVAVMTSNLSHDRFVEHAVQNNFYGLQENQLTFFAQEVLPLLDEKGDWFYEKPGQLALGPDGNGRVFYHLEQTGILKRWKAQGIEVITVIQVDNPLADPFDPYLLHELILGKYEVVARAIERIDPEEKIGVFAKQEGRLCVVEYSEIDEEKKTARGEDGRFVYPFANVGGYAFTLEFVDKVAQKNLPWHIARKEAVCTQAGSITCAKFETFIFDLLPFATKASLLYCNREECYAPVKNKDGDKSPMTVLSKIAHLI